MLPPPPHHHYKHTYYIQVIKKAKRYFWTLVLSEIKALILITTPVCVIRLMLDKQTFYGDHHFPAIDRAELPYKAIRNTFFFRGPEVFQMHTEQEEVMVRETKNMLHVETKRKFYMSFNFWFANLTSEYMNMMNIFFKYLMQFRFTTFMFVFVFLLFFFWGGGYYQKDCIIYMYRHVGLKQHHNRKAKKISFIHFF